MHRLPIIRRSDSLNWEYYDYWINFKKEADKVTPGETYYGRRDRLLAREGGYLVSNSAMETEIEFKTEADRTFFLIRWS